VVLYFYPRDDTPGCTKEACGFRDLWRRIQKQNAVVLGVSPDGAEAHQKFAVKYKLPFTLLSDPTKKTMEKYGAFGEKMMYGKKTTGVIRSTVWIGPKTMEKYGAFGEKMMYGKKTTGVIRSTVWIGPDGRVVRHWKRVAKAADHPAHVLEALQQQR
jgi:peroxiredoxin Q/BCP